MTVPCPGCGEERGERYSPITGHAVDPSAPEGVCYRCSPAEQPRARSTVTSFDKIQSRPVKWLWQDRIAQRKIAAMSGRPKIGKGQLYVWIAAQVTRGKLAGDLLGQPKDVLIVTTEDEPGDTLKPRLQAAGADLSRVHTFTMGSSKEPVPFRVPQDSDELAKRVTEFDIDAAHGTVHASDDCCCKRPAKRQCAGARPHCRERRQAPQRNRHTNIP